LTIFAPLRPNSPLAGIDTGLAFANVVMSNSFAAKIDAAVSIDCLACELRPIAARELYQSAIGNNCRIDTMVQRRLT
jgi:hypothetical protein